MGYYTLDNETFETYEKKLNALYDAKDEVRNPGNWDYNFVEDLHNKLIKYERSLNLSKSQRDNIDRIMDLWNVEID